MCRAIRTSSSFSFLEVVVSYEVSGRDRTPENLSYNADDKGGRKIFFHLKKFFRGARFTWLPFLNRIQEGYRPGDLVCVSGKVSLLVPLNLSLYVSVTVISCLGSILVCRNAS